MPPCRRPLALLALALAALLLAVPARAGAIVGGQTATEAWPNMAGMEFRETESGAADWSFRCGASLVAPDVVLTAAHCVHDDSRGGIYAPQDFRFVVGTHKRSSGGERIAVTRVLEHPQYATTGTYDVALLLLERPTSLGGTIRLAQPDEAPLWQPDKEATVVGWGAEVPEGPATDDLRQVAVPIRSDSECGLFNPGLQPATELCAGNRTGGQDSCQGDSGGPLMVNSSGTWVQVGVVSYGTGCAFPTQYGVYAEAAGDALRGWVEENAQAMTSGRPIGSVPAGSGAPGGAAPLAAPSASRLSVSARLRRSRLLVTIRSTERLRRITARLRRGSRTVATATRASPGRSARLRLRRAPGARLRTGRHTLRVIATDTAGRRTVVVRRVTVRR